EDIRDELQRSRDAVLPPAVPLLRQPDFRDYLDGNRAEGESICTLPRVAGSSTVRRTLRCRRDSAHSPSLPGRRHRTDAWHFRRDGLPRWLWHPRHPWTVDRLDIPGDLHHWDDKSESRPDVEAAGHW